MKGARSPFRYLLPAGLIFLFEQGGGLPGDTAEFGLGFMLLFERALGFSEEIGTEAFHFLPETSLNSSDASPDTSGAELSREGEADKGIFTAALLSIATGEERGTLSVGLAREWRKEGEESTRSCVGSSTQPDA